MLRSVIVKNVLLFVAILVVAVVPLAWQFDRDSRASEIQNLASKLEFFAERGAAWLDVAAIATLTRPEHRSTDAYRKLLADLNRIKREFDVDNAVVMRRDPGGRYRYVAIDHDGFGIGDAVHIHDLFPATFQATEATWQAGEMMHSQLFGGRVGDTEYAQFVQINTPLKVNGEVVAILMLNKFADPVAAAVRAKTLRVTALSAALIAIGLALFALISARMLRPLKVLTAAAAEVARGNLDVSLPAARSRDEVGRLSTAFTGMLEGLRQRDFIRDTFGRYVSKEVVETLLGSPEGLALGGERREITLLVSDLRGFTSLASRLPAEEVIRILNRYLERVVEVLTRYRATVDEFQGDGILAFFGAPLAAADDPQRAVACAIEMQRAIARMNEEQRRLGLPDLQMGVGVNTGEVIVGNIGSETRTKYGAVGSAINLAYRIESQTVGGQVLVGPNTFERVRAMVKVRRTVEAHLKGFDAPLTLYDVVGMDGPYAVALPDAATVTLVRLSTPLPVTCFPIDGKRVSASGVSGRITELSESGAVACLGEPVERGDNVRIVLDGSHLAEVVDEPAVEELELYAKVVSVHPGHAGPGGIATSLVFTSVSPSARCALDQARDFAGHPA